jgi:DNA-binding NarL/FixJ family response regulator
MKTHVHCDTASGIDKRKSFMEVPIQRIFISGSLDRTEIPKEQNPVQSSDPIRIMLVEDHPLFRQGLNIIIASQSDMQVVAQAGTSLEAVEEFRHHKPDITLMDQRLPGQTGTSALVAIRKEFSAARVIMLTTSEGDVEIKGALCAGASAYVLKSTPSEELFSIIRSVHNGRTHIPTGVACRLAEHLGQENLTEREMEVLRLIQGGNRNKQIAEQLSLSENTVNFHVKNVMDKLQANDRAHAISIAIRRGILNV